MHDVPYGFCHCGCGGRTQLASRTSIAKSLVKGEPVRYLIGHHRRKPITYKVEDRGYKTPCWIWGLTKNQYGYGRFRPWGSDKTYPAHRWFYERHHGQTVPEALDIGHLCRQPSCVNPDHLEPVTRAENARRGRQSKLTAATVVMVKFARATTTLTLDELAEMCGVSNGCIQGVLYRGRAWKDMRPPLRELKGRPVLSAEDQILEARATGERQAI